MSERVWFESRGRGLWPVSVEGWLLSLVGLFAMFIASFSAVQLALAGELAIVAGIVIAALAFATGFLLLAIRRTRWRRFPR